MKLEKISEKNISYTVSNEGDGFNRLMGLNQFILPDSATSPADLLLHADPLWVLSDPTTQ